MIRSAPSDQVSVVGPDASTPSTQANKLSLGGLFQGHSPFVDYVGLQPMTDGDDYDCFNGLASLCNDWLL